MKYPLAVHYVASSLWAIDEGKLAGIITQSLCREIFFEQLQIVHNWTSKVEGVDLIGQFHDEIVIDWVPGYAVQLDGAKSTLESRMSFSQSFPRFPMGAEIKDDYRYTK